MPIDKSLTAGSAAMLVLKLLQSSDMYGYQMIEELSSRSQNVFEFKTGTLYPLLHTLESKEWITSYEREENGRTRKYYSITESGKTALTEKESQWEKYTSAVSMVLKGGANLVRS